MDLFGKMMFRGGGGKANCLQIHNSTLSQLITLVKCSPFYIACFCDTMVFWEASSFSDFWPTSGC